MKKFTLKLTLLLGILISAAGYSQNLQKSRQESYLTYIYKLSNEQTKTIYKKRNSEKFIESFLTQAIDSFPTDIESAQNAAIRKLPIGHYVFIKAVNNYTDYSMLTIASFRTFLYSEHKRLLFHVSDKNNNQAITNAKVTVNGKKVKFDTKSQSYILPKSKKQDFISVTLNNQENFFFIGDYNEYYNENSIGRYLAGFWYRLRHLKFNHKDYRLNYNGYIAFNKPKYLPRDTVKLKAFIVDKKGKPLKKEIKLKLQQQYESTENYLCQLKPTTDGAYSYEFVLSDSLTIDQYFTINAFDPKGKTITENNFYLEDYQLNETNYLLRKDKSEYNCGDKINLFASGKDANGFNLLDARVEIEAIVNDVKEIYGKKVFIPKQLWQHKQNLDPTGETKFSIPDSIFPNALIEVKLKVIFNNSNNESRDTLITFNYDGKKNNIEIKTDSTFITADYFVGGKNVSATALMVKEYEQGLHAKETITLPYKGLVDANAEAYRFETDSFTSKINMSYEFVNLNIYGTRTFDSVFIYSENPRGVDIIYSIYKKEKEIETGITKKIYWKIKDISDDDYKIVYHYTWAGRTNNETRDFPNYKNNLNVTITQPQSVYPGEKVDVKIKVTDFKDQPVKNVDLTALAINSQFDQSNIPNIPYLGSPKYGSPYLPYKPLEHVGDFINGQIPLTKKRREQMRLDTISYYKMLYPKDGFYYNYDSVKSINAQFSPFIFRNGFQEPIYCVYLDNKPVYYYNTYNADNYVFKTSPGRHFIKIRTYDKMYYMDSLILNKGIKTDIAIDADNLPGNAAAFIAPKQLDQFERDQLSRSVFEFYSESKNKIYIWQQNNVCEIPPPGTYEHNRLFRLCGFFTDSVNYLVQNEFQQKILLEQNYIYSVKKSLVKMQEFNLFKNPIQLPSSLPTKQMGQKALPLTVIVPKTPDNAFEKFVTKNPSYTEEKNGTYDFTYTGDSTIALIKISSYKDSLVRFYGNEKRGKIFDLTSGYYKLLFITPYNNVFELDSVKILAKGTYYHRFDDMMFNNRSKKDSSLFKSLSRSGVPDINFTGGSGTIKVFLTDKNTLESIPFSNVVVYDSGVQKAVAVTDMDGEAIFHLPAGRYDIKAVYVGYQASEIKRVLVSPSQTTRVDIKLSNREGVNLSEVEIVSYNAPVVNGMSIARILKTQKGVASYGDDRFLEDGPSLGAQTYYFADLNIKDGQIVGRLDFTPSSYNLSPANGGFEKKEPEAQNRLRNKFSDYAYWKPNLTTNENGEATFKANFPDNITNWKAYALAMNANKQSGMGSTQTRAYKSIMASLSLPRFLVEGDSTFIIGKALNYSNKEVPVTTFFKKDNEQLKRKDTLLKNSFIQTIPLSVTGKDSVKISFNLEQKEGAKDGEERSLAVYPIGTEETEGYFLALNKDTTITLDLKDGNTEIYMQNDPFDFLLKELDQLQNYPHACMEQTASKLNAYLMEEKIKNSLKQKFTHTKEINNLLKRLIKSQKENGSWGWWEDSPENVWMTTYILEVLSKAKDAGYYNDDNSKAIHFLNIKLSFLNGNELLNALHALSEAEVQIPYAEYLKKLEKAELTLSQKLIILIIKQKNNLDHSLDLLTKEKKSTLFGNYYWGSESFDWYDNNVNATLLAYRLFENKDSLHAYLPFIRNYFLEIKQQNKWRNTIETAKILQTILPAITRNGAHLQKPVIEMKGDLNETITQFPYKKSVGSVKKITISKKGASPVYFTAYQKRWNKTPVKKDEIFAMTTYYELNGKRTDSLKAGQPLDLVVEIRVKKKSEYVMIEVPIPAGCSYDNNTGNTSYLEVHREYFKNKTSIFCENLPQGTHTFKIKVQPRFKGSYTLNPAKTESMYFPVFYGRNGIKKVKIH